jgi:demethylmenaquinone methyltransferase/2-methoxy-6-polyprenyl-1,4-benzoquinol methylase
MSSQVQDLFNRIAPVYDRLNDWLSLGSHRLWKKLAIQFAEVHAGETWLDLCCGSGDLAGLLAGRVGSSGQVIGVDFAVQQLTIARQRFPYANIQWRLGDALALDCGDGSLDGVMISYGLRNVMDISQCLGEVYRVLKPSGRMVVLDFHYPYSPAMKAFQQFYLENVVVPTARRFELEQEYAYIFPSLLKFPQGKTQEELARLVGFSRAVHYPIALEMMGILVAEK